jgi:hypothetical protein
MKIARTSSTMWLWRLSATMLLVLFFAFLTLPIAAASQDGSDASLPACCHTHGRHHCSMGRLTGSQQSDTPAFAQLTEKCPYAPSASVNSHNDPRHPGLSALIHAEIVSHPAVHAQTVARRRIAFDRSRQKRGPPIFLLLALKP